MTPQEADLLLWNCIGRKGKRKLVRWVYYRYVVKEKKDEARNNR